MTALFLRPDVAAEFRARIKAGVAPTAEQLAEFRAQRSAGPRNLRVASDVAEIRVVGLLTPQPDFFAMFLGISNTTYSDIRDSLAAAASDPAVRSVSMYVDSPGGTVNGLFDTLAALESFSKPISVRAAQACSAAYAIAALAGPITATNIAAAFGSIGVAASIFIDPDTVDIASTDAPNKRPDVTTPQGKAIVQGELDDLHELFADAIARGRKTTVARVNKEFGRGGVVLAGEAKQRGMIDHLPSATRSSTSKSSAAARSEKVIANMDIETARAQYPEVVAVVKQATLTEERDRINGHLTLGEATGEMAYAWDAVKKGTPLTTNEIALYMTADKRRKALADRQADSDAVAAATAGATPPPNHGVMDSGDLVAQALGLPPPGGHRPAAPSSAGPDEGDLVARALNLPQPSNTRAVHAR